jgi:hypothetical protein
MDFDEFLRKEKEVYDRFRDTSKLVVAGLDPKIPTQQGGYLITYRHPNSITNRLGEFSRQVSEIVPSIIYDRENAHTTISDFQVQDNFSAETTTLNQLADIVYSCLPLSGVVFINYSGWLLNQNTGIAEGYPNQPFVEHASKIVDLSHSNGVQIRPPWGAHITTSRFLQTCSQEEVSELIDLFKHTKPLGESKPEFLDVGYFIFSREGFKYNIHERFKV